MDRSSAKINTNTGNFIQSASLLLQAQLHL